MEGLHPKTVRERESPLTSLKIFVRYLHKERRRLRSSSHYQGCYLLNSQNSTLQVQKSALSSLSLYPASLKPQSYTCPLLLLGMLSLSSNTQLKLAPGCYALLSFLLFSLCPMEFIWPIPHRIGCYPLSSAYARYRISESIGFGISSHSR